MLTDSLFNLLFKLKTYSGLFAVESSNKFKCLTYTYLIVMFVMFFSQLICQIMVIALKLSLGDGSDAACVSAMFLETCILIVLNLWRGQRAEINYRETVNTVDGILKQSDLEYSTRSVKRYSTVFNTLIILYSINVTILQVIQIFIKAVSFLQILDVVPSHYMWIYAMPWPTNEYTYWPTLILQGLTTLFMIIIQQVNIYFITSMILLQTLGLHHLRTSLASIIQPSSQELVKGKTLQLLKPLYSSKYYQDKQEERQYEQLISWIKLHSKLVCLFNEFVVIYTPMFSSYFLVVFGILLAGVFALMQNANYFGLAESILLGLYFAGIMFNLFVLSIAGTNLTFESNRVFEEGFHAPWYNCSPRIKSSVLIIGAATKIPIIFTPFRSEHFTLSLLTFIWVIKTMGSVYIGLAEVKRRAEEAGQL